MTFPSAPTADSPTRIALQAVAVCLAAAIFLPVFTNPTPASDFAGDPAIIQKFAELAAEDSKRTYPLLIAGRVSAGPDGAFLTTAGDQTIPLRASGRRGFDRYDGRAVMARGLVHNAHTPEEFMLVKGLKVIDSLEEIEGVHRDIEAGAYRVDQKPASLVSRKGDVYVIDGFRWYHERTSSSRKGFSVLRRTAIDVSGVKSISFLLEPFKPEMIAAHAMLLINTEKGTVTCGDAWYEPEGIIVSVEAFLKHDQEYDLMRGLKKSFRQVYQLGTREDRLIDDIVHRRKAIREYPLALEKAQMEEIFRAALEASTLDHNSEYYNTYMQNCANNIIRLINMGLEKNQRVREWLLPRIFYNPMATVPVLTGRHLIKKGIAREEVQLDSLEGVPVEEIVEGGRSRKGQK